MGIRLGTVTLLVRDQDEAIGWYREALGFELAEDSKLDRGRRWVRLRAGDGGADLLLAKPSTEEQEWALGRAAGGRIAYFLETDDFDSMLVRMRRYGVRLLEEPRTEAYGRVVKFADLYGNGWDLIQPARLTGEQ
jgi:catechol 2,3-dioxygenase-like lactoylglutathione lyase family enzyme